MKRIMRLVTMVAFSFMLMACVGDNEKEKESNVASVQKEPVDEGDGIDTMIELTREEKIRSFTLEEEYIFQDKKIEGNIDDSRPLSDDALLYLIQEYYPPKDKWAEYLLPNLDEITYKDIKDIVKQLLQTYVNPSEEPEKIVVGYTNNQLVNRETERPEYASKWYAFCSFTNGDDYGVWIDAITGELLYLARYPMDWFDDKKNHGEFQILEKGDFSVEDILKAASDYLENLGILVESVELASTDNSEEILLKSLDYGEEVKIPNRRVDVVLADGNTMYIKFLVEDLSIQEIYVR